MSSLIPAVLLLALLGGQTDWSRDFIGPSVILPDGRTVNAAAHYWTDIVGVPFRRAATVDVPPTPIDLDLDEHPDTVFRGHWELPGGILGSPELIGLVSTPDDPAGTVGEHSISTGFLGLREELDPQTKRGTGRFAFNCWLCHASAEADGRIRLGRPNTRINLGLILAASRVLEPDWAIRDSADGDPLTPSEIAKRESLPQIFRLDANADGKVTIAEWRAALRMPPVSVARAEVLLAGPGRLDQSIDHRMDGLIPLANIQHHNMDVVGMTAYLRQASSPKRSVFNPVSIPGNLVGVGVAHYSWSGKDSSYREDPLELFERVLKLAPAAVAAKIDFPLAGVDQSANSAAPTAIDYELLTRVLTLDFRNVATAGKEDDDNRGTGWPEKLLTHPDAATLSDVPPLFGGPRLRSILMPTIEQRAGASSTPAPLNDAPPDAEFELGLRLFAEASCGEIINQRVLVGRETHVPQEYRGIAVIAPLDRSRPLTARIPVRCATCHNYSPTSARKPLPQVSTTRPGRLRAMERALQRCDVCHLDHPDVAALAAGGPRRFRPLAEHMTAEGLKSVYECTSCHAEHYDFGSQVFSNSWLLPFDANANGQTSGDELADAAAGGIGTDAGMNIDTLFSVQLRPPDRRPRKLHMLVEDGRREPEKPRFGAQGIGWVRVAPLIDLAGSPPYLHNGSVPALADLLSEPSRRPKQFPVGTAAQGFVLDTLLPGNRNGGHDFGTKFSDAEKRALLRFLESLP